LSKGVKVGEKGGRGGRHLRWGLRKEVGAPKSGENPSEVHRSRRGVADHGLKKERIAAKMLGKGIVVGKKRPQNTKRGIGLQITERGN